MADTLTQLIAKVQAQLIDNGTLFTTATATAAIRQGLAHINRAVPDNAGTLITVETANQKEYDLSDYDPEAVGITDVLLSGENEHDAGLAYDAYVEDSRWFFRLREAQPVGAVLIVHYAIPYTISGLDSETDSTLPDALNVAAIDAGCFYACLVRAGATIESNNVQPNVSANWLKLADMWSKVLAGDLLNYRRQPTVKGEPTPRTWEDPQHSEIYP